jgi:hypothetical protein
LIVWTGPAKAPATTCREGQPVKDGHDRVVSGEVIGTPAYMIPAKVEGWLDL